MEGREPLTVAAAPVAGGQSIEDDVHQAGIDPSPRAVCPSQGTSDLLAGTRGTCTWLIAQAGPPPHFNKLPTHKRALSVQNLTVAVGSEIAAVDPTELVAVTTTRIL